MSSTFLGMPPVPASLGSHLQGTRAFPDAAHDALQDGQLRRNLGRATRTIRDKRLRVTAEVPDWEELRLAGEGIKASTMARPMPLAPPVMTTQRSRRLGYIANSASSAIRRPYSG